MFHGVISPLSPAQSFGLLQGRNMQALMTVTGKAAPPTIENAARQLIVAVEAIDRSYGVVPLAPAAGTFTVRVEVERPSSGDETTTYSNPSIEPFGGALVKEDK